MFKVLVPRENTNDDDVKVVDLRMEEGKRVEADELLAVLETSKATFDVRAEVPGFIRGLKLSEGDRVGVGQVLCYITEREDEPLPNVEAKAPEPALAAGDGPRFTRRARELAERHGIAAALFAGHPGLVTEADVTSRLAAAPAAPPAAPAPERTSARASGEFSRSALVLFGGGGRARVCIDLLRQMGGYEIIGVLDDKLKAGSRSAGVEVIGDRSRLGELFTRGVRFAVNALGSAEHSEPRLEVHRLLLEHGFVLPNLIHPRAMVEPSVVMGIGNQILAGAVVGSAVRLGDGVTVNCGAIASHDSVLEDHVHLAPGAILAGSVHVGAESLVGMGATVYLKVRLGRRVRIKNGSHVFGNVPDGETR
jgi:sugar O-acyltransferase (sialic acid O-acetyltransferase NeuD family)